MKKAAVIALLILLSSVSGANVILSDQGSDVYFNDELVNNGDITVEIWDTSTGGTCIYNQTFQNNITAGNWNVVLGELTPLNLTFGTRYYKDYEIDGSDLDFTNMSGGAIERKAFDSPLGTITTGAGGNTSAEIAAVKVDNAVHADSAGNATYSNISNHASYADYATDSGNATWANNASWASNATTSIWAQNVEWGNILNKFIESVATPWFYMTGTQLNFNTTTLDARILSVAPSGKQADRIYLYNDSTTIYFNETLLNTTIDARGIDTQKQGDGVYLYNDSTIIYLNETYLNATIDSRELWNTTAQVIVAANQSGYLKDWNSTGHIKDWNSSGWIKNWNASGSIQNYNASGSIRNYNASGNIKDWNQTGQIRNWSKEIVIPEYTAGSNMTLLGYEFSLNTTSLKTWLDTVYAAIGSGNLWNRTGTTLIPHTANDSVDLGSGTLFAKYVEWNNTNADCEAVRASIIDAGPLLFQGQTAGEDVLMALAAADSDGTDSVNFVILGDGEAADFTNRETLIMGWNGGTAYKVATEENGTGTAQPLNLYAGTDNEGGHILLEAQGTIDFDLIQDIAVNQALFHFVTDAVNGLTSSDGQQNYLQLDPKITQTGTAGYTGLGMNVNEVSTGSATNYLVDLEVGNSDRFSIESDGDVNILADSYINFGDTATNIAQLDDGHLDLTADTSIDLNSISIGLGDNSADVEMNFYGDTAYGQLNWMADDDGFHCYDDFRMHLQEKIEFNDATNYIHYDGTDVTLGSGTGFNIKPTATEYMTVDHTTIGAMGDVPTIEFTSTNFLAGTYWGGIKDGLAILESNQLGQLIFVNSDASSTCSISHDDTNDRLHTDKNFVIGNGGAKTWSLIFDDHNADGQLDWEGGTDNFVFQDDVLMNADEKTYYRDTALGIYSQADTFLDLFADGGVRIGDSGIGAPTNYTQFADDGRQTMAGTARYWIGFEIDNTGFKEPTSLSPTLVNRGLGTAYEYSDGDVEHIHATMRITERWDDTENIEVTLIWETPATTKNCYWDVQYQLKAADEDMTDTSATSCAEHLKASSGTANGLIHSTFTIPTAAFDAGDKILSLVVYRRGDELTDTLADSAYVHKMILRGIADNLGGVVT